MYFFYVEIRVYYIFNKSFQNSFEESKAKLNVSIRTFMRDSRKKVLEKKFDEKLMINHKFLLLFD